MVNKVKHNNKVMYSFIVPFYNNESYLNKCVESIERQKIRNFEVLLIDDGSTDKSGSIAEKLATKYQNITVFKQKNKGQTSARKLGLNHAKGNYICLVDSDDWLNTTYLSKIDYYVQKYTDVDLLFFNGIEIHQDCKKNLPYSSTKKKEFYNKQMICTELRKCLIFPNKYGSPVRWHAWGAVYKKDLLKKYIVKDDSIRVAEDGITLAMCVYNANSICFIDDSLYYYNCCNDNSIGNIHGKWNYPEYYIYLIRNFQNADSDIVNQLYVHYCWTLNAGFFRSEILEGKKLSRISKDFYNCQDPFYKIFWCIKSMSKFPIKFKLFYMLTKCRLLKIYLFFYKVFLKLK